MTQGRSIRLFLVDGSPNGLLTAEIMNWTGHVLTGPRSKLSELVKRPECSRTGVYFLIGPDPENSLRPLVYVGETDDVAYRLKQHNRPEERGGKDFWEKVCLITSKDQNLTKAHVKYLESMLLRTAGTAGRCTLMNGTAHDYGNLPESDQADMQFFHTQMQTIMPVLGYDFLRQSAQPSGQKSAKEGGRTESPRFVLNIRKHGIRAVAQEIDGEFVVLEGSEAREEWGPKGYGYESLFIQLCDTGVLESRGNGKRVFTRDHGFPSLSAAGAVVSGYNVNGRKIWVTETDGQTYADWQDQQVSAANPEEETEKHA